MLKRSFASFVLACLLFSASLLPCFIEPAAASSTSDLGEYVCDVFPFVNGTTDYQWKSFSVPCSDYFGLYSGTLSVSSTSPWFGMRFISSIFESTSFDRTVVFTVSPVSYGSGSTVDFQWGSDGSSCDVHWKSDTDSADLFNVLTDGCTVSGSFRSDSNLIGRSAPYTYFVTVPSGANYFEVLSVNTNQWQIITSGSSTWNVDCFGAYVLNTADRDLISLVQRILSQLQDTDTDIENIGQTLATVVNQLISLNSDTDTIITLLQSLEGLSTNQLAQLEKISTSVDAIYYFLTEALKSESEDMSQAAQDTADQIDNSSTAEQYWQTSMQGNYDSLDLDNFNFGGVTSGIELVGRIFQDMFDAFGSYKILFTFPLTLGISLLVVGRLSKFGGGNSSRNKEHKGGEGGA